MNEFEVSEISEASSVHTFGGEAGSPYETEGIGLHWKCCTKLFSVPEKEEVRKSREKWPQLLRDESARDSMVLAFREHVKKKRMALMVLNQTSSAILRLICTGKCALDSS